MTVNAGSVLNSNQGFIGEAPNGTGVATVTGAGSQWDIVYSLYVGDAGIGTLTIEQGGLVSDSYGTIGDETGSTGTARVTGAGSKWTNQGLNVGEGVQARSSSRQGDRSVVAWPISATGPAQRVRSR